MKSLVDHDRITDCREVARNPCQTVPKVSQRLLILVPVSMWFSLEVITVKGGRIFFLNDYISSLGLRTYSYHFSKNDSISVRVTMVRRDHCFDNQL